MSKSLYKKIIPTLLILSIIIPTSLLTSTKKSEAAGIPVVDVLLNTSLNEIFHLEVIPILAGLAPGDAQKEGGLFGMGYDGIAYYLARIAIRQITQSIVDWINSGFEGNPSFVQDPKKFLLGVADRTIGEFIYDSDLGFLCKPFEINIRLALGLQYSPFQDKIRCKLSSVLQNVDGAVTDTYNKFVNGDFIGGGGWDSWLQLTTVPQNNQLGAMIIAQSELDARINAADNNAQKELSWSGGLLSMKDCDEIRKDKDGNEKSRVKFKGDPSTRGISNGSGTSTLAVRSNGQFTGESVTTSCRIVTPGSLITDQMQKVTGLDLDALNMADEINEIVGALANFVVSKVMEKGMALINKDELSADNQQWRDGLLSLRNEQYQGLQSNSTNIGFNPPSSATNNVNPNAQQTNVDRNQILALISSYLSNEVLYLGAYSSIFEITATTSAEYLNVINCYSDKLASTTLTLTSNDRQNASSSISVASSTIEAISPLISSSTININITNSNISTLRSIQSSASYATTIEEINSLNNSLSSISSRLHNTTDVLNAQNLSSSTMSTFVQGTASSTALLQQAINMKTECEDFPL